MNVRTQSCDNLSLITPLNLRQINSYICLRLNAYGTLNVFRPGVNSLVKIYVRCFYSIDISLVVSILKSDIAPKKITASIGNVFELGSRILSINSFVHKKIFSYTSGKVFNITFNISPVSGKRYTVGNVCQLPSGVQLERIEKTQI